MENKEIKGYRVISSPEDVAQFFMYLVFDRGCMIDPDDDFEDYINTNDMENVFSGEEIKVYNDMMEISWNICKINNVDIYEIYMRVCALWYACNNLNDLRDLYDENCKVYENI